MDMGEHEPLRITCECPGDRHDDDCLVGFFVQVPETEGSVTPLVAEPRARAVRLPADLRAALAVLEAADLEPEVLPRVVRRAS